MPGPARAQAPATESARPEPMDRGGGPAAEAPSPGADESRLGQGPGASVSVVVVRNLFAGNESRPEVTLQPGAPLALAGERVRVEGIQRLRVESPDPQVRVALHFRRDSAAAERWSLVVIVPSRRRPHDYLYLSAGEQAQGGRLSPQTSYRVGQGLETDLTPEGGAVSEIVVQDEGDSELRLRRSDGALVLAIVPPEAGGHPTGATRPWYRDEPLRFLDYQVLVGGYAKAVFDNDYAGWMLPSGTTEHAFVEATVRDTAGVRAATFTKPHESLSVEQFVFTMQAVRGEWWSLWAEAGASASQRTRSSAPAQSAVGWTAGAAAHVRFGDWGGSVRWADTDGPSLLQALAGWQATRHVGVALSWISYRSASAAGLAVSFGF